jgi:hypothetical protein
MFAKMVAMHPEPMDVRVTMVVRTWLFLPVCSLFVLIGKEFKREQAD